MEVTKITTQAKNPNRVNLHVDGKFYRGLDKIVAMKLGLKPGIALTPYLIDKLDDTQTQNSAWEYTLRSLRRSSQSIKTLKQKLTNRFEPEVVETTIKKLVANNILNDERLAVAVVGQSLEQGIKSKRQIIARLITKGLPHSIIQEVTTTIGRDYEQTTALKLAQYKNRQLKDLTWREKFEKIAAYLARRGFNYDLIKQVVTEEALEAKELT